MKNDTLTIVAVVNALVTSSSLAEPPKNKRQIPDEIVHDCRMALVPGKDGKREIHHYALTLETTGDHGVRQGVARINPKNGPPRVEKIMLSLPKRVSHGRTRWKYEQGDGIHCDAFDVDEEGRWRFSRCGGGGEATCEPTSDQGLGFQEPTHACINDVEGAFHRLPTDVGWKRYLYAFVDKSIVPPPAFTTSWSENNMGIDNHFQGIQRLPTNLGPYLVVSGDDINVPGSFLFIVEMGSRSSSGPWSLPRGNTVADKKLEDVYHVSKDDRMVTRVRVDQGKLWHVGGLQVWGNVLAVPLEVKDGTDSKVAFYDLSKPKNPVLLPTSITRTKSAGGAVAFARMKNGRYLLADFDSQVDFYWSKTNKLEDGFDAPVRWNVDNVHAIEDEDESFEEYQTINFIPQCDGKLFLAGFINDGAFGDALGTGTDWVDLFKVDFPKGIGSVPVLTHVAYKHMYCFDNQCDFAGAAGIYLAGPNKLSIYSSDQFLHERPELRFNEYAGH